MFLLDNQFAELYFSFFQEIRRTGNDEPVHDVSHTHGED
jgi:hypothetical protein